MKNSILKLFFYSALIFMCKIAVGQNAETQQKFEALYQRWHIALDAHRSLTEPLWFGTNGPQDLTLVVNEIENNKIAMASFLCEKMAQMQYTGFQINGGSRFYQDIWLLNEVAGINLITPDTHSLTNVNLNQPGAAIQAEVHQKIYNDFRDQWRAGIYKDPSQKIAQLCAEKLSKEGNSRIIPEDLIAIRRYGIFALPELIKEIEKQNSKHAFAAYQIITGQWREYDDYIQNSEQHFTTAEAKLSDLKVKLEKLKNGNENFDVIKKISAALAE